VSTIRDIGHAVRRARSSTALVVRRVWRRATAVRRTFSVWRRATAVRRTFSFTVRSG